MAQGTIPATVFEQRPASAGQSAAAHGISSPADALVFIFWTFARTAASAQQCPCGHPFQLLAVIEGRANDLLVLADGRTLGPSARWYL